MNAKIVSQLPLNLNLDNQAKFENFLEFDRHSEIITELKKESPVIFLRGAASSGRSHLLQAVCHEAIGKQKTSLFLPLSCADNYSPEFLIGVERLDVVCLDDIQAIGTNVEWEEAIFRLYNSVLDTKCKLIISSDKAPHQLSITLADLRSRLCSFPVFMLDSPNEKEKLEILKFRAQLRGLKLADEPIKFILNRVNRSLKEIMDLLDALDSASLAEKRHITIPLIKKVMDW
ncbi:MAG: DnaA regulatory inactivator Hda [Gammaproteobacteria bacterium]|nr:DnaA regulatory inactivator Hda [Gammaproteobacteria bacterium]